MRMLMGAMLEFQRQGAILFDYGNNIRRERVADAAYRLNGRSFPRSPLYDCRGS